jgi:hypothetical protein
MLGKLDWSVVPLGEPIPLAAGAAVFLVIVAVLGWITRARHWRCLWSGWITSVDHKRIGVMCCLLGLVMLLRGFADAIMMQTHQALAIGAPGYLPPDHYDQIFSAHGTIMIFFGAMPFAIGLMNFVVPLQLGVRDVALPTLNSASFWLTASGALLVNLSLVDSDLGRRHAAVRRQPGDDDPQDARARHGLSAHADVLLDRARIEHADRRGLPDLDRDAGDADVRPVYRFHFFTNGAGGIPMMFMNLIWASGPEDIPRYIS